MAILPLADSATLATIGGLACSARLMWSRILTGSSVGCLVPFSVITMTWVLAGVSAARARERPRVRRGFWGGLVGPEPAGGAGAGGGMDAAPAGDAGGLIVAGD